METLADLEYINQLTQFLILLVQFAILVIPFFGDEAVYRKDKKHFKKISVKGYILILCGIILAILTWKQYIVTDKISDIKEIEVSRDSSKRDSITQRKFSDEAFKTTSMLAKYGLKVDSKNQEIVKILRDSSLRKTTIINGSIPSFQLCNITLKRDSLKKYNFKLNYCSANATSYDINVKLDILYLSKSGKFLYLLRNNRQIEGRDLNAGGYIEPEIEVDKPAFAHTIIFHVKANYKTKQNDSIPIYLDKSWSFPADSKNPKFSTLTPNYADKLNYFLRTEKVTQGKFKPKR